MEDAGEVGVETGMGLGRGFLDPLQTLYDNSGRLVGLGHDLYRGDFLRISNASFGDMARFASVRAGEVVGIAAALIPIGKVASVGIRCGIAIAKQGYARIVAKAAQQAMKEGGAYFAAKETGLISAERSVGMSLVKNEARTGIVANAKAQEVLQSARSSSSEYVNLASKSRTNHILYGEKSGLKKGFYQGGHLYRGLPGKTRFPTNWNGDKVMHAVSDIATDPKIPWQIAKDNSSRCIAEGVREGQRIRVIVEPNKEGIISGFPLR
jgi:hypothetical protein